MAGNDPSVFGPEGIQGPSETRGVGDEAPAIDARIQDRGAATGRVSGSGGTLSTPPADGLQLSDVDDDAPIDAARLQALRFGVDTGGETERERKAVLGRVRVVDQQIDAAESQLHDAMHEGDTAAAEAHAEALTTLFRQRVALTDELESLGDEQPQARDDGWVDEAPEEPIPVPSLSAQDESLAAFIEATLVSAESPHVGQSLGAHMVAAGRHHAVDPLLLLAIAAHESEYGRQGDRLFGLGESRLSAAAQTGLAADVFARLRRQQRCTPETSPRAQIDAVTAAGWSLETSWGEAVEAHYEGLRAAQG